MFQPLFLQQVDLEGGEVGTQSFLDLILQGGPLSIVIVGFLVFLSFIAVFIFLERYWTIKKAGQIDQGFMNNILSYQDINHAFIDRVSDKHDSRRFDIKRSNSH